MTKGLSERVRKVAERDYVRPALSSGAAIEIIVGDLHQTLRNEGFPAAHINQVCSALESEKFWKAHGLELRTPIGQARRLSTKYHFRITTSRKFSKHSIPEKDPLLELAGILKGAIREGAGAFLRELRRDKVASR